MNRLRVFVLILLAVLLPVRGAVAAAMLCPDGVDPKAAVTAVDHDHHHVDSRGDHASGDSRNAEPSDEAGAFGEHPNSCHVCATGCCMATIIGSVPSVMQVTSAASARFPAITAPVPVFHSEGQERPPRAT